MRNKYAIKLLFLANIISGIAQGISMIAIPWYFVEIVNRSDLFTEAYLIITFLTLFWGLYAGTLVDRYPRIRLFILVNIICGVSIAIISAFGFYSQSLPSILVILVFAITIFNYNIHYPNLYAFAQEISEPKDYGKLNSYIEIQGQSTSVIAGAMAAFLLTGIENNTFNLAGFSFKTNFDFEPWKIYEIFLLDAFTYLIVISLFLLMKYNPVAKEKIQTGSLVSRLKGGIDFLSSNIYIFIFGLFSYMLFAFTLVDIHIVLPSYVHNFLKMGSDVYASAEVYYSLGALISGFLVLKIFNKFNIVASVLALISIIAIFFFAMTFYNSLKLFFIATLILGVTNAGVRILRTTYLFNVVPNNLIGRVNSVFGSLNIVIRMLMIGSLALPFFHINDNIRFAYLIGSFLLLFAIIILLIFYKKINSRSK